MYPQAFHAAPAATIRSLSMIESKESIDTWFNQVKAFLRAIPAYQKYMDLTWTAHANNPTRGFTDTRDAGGNTVRSTSGTSTTSPGSPPVDN